MEVATPSISNITWNNWLDKWFLWLTAIGIIVNASGLLLPILEPDGALYATIAKHIAITGDYINLIVDGNDWLDKPHFPFWITAFSFKIFGINSFAYKFPALIFWLGGAYYTYAFAKKLYNRQTAQLAVLLYLAIEHLIISNNDVRAEPYLTGLMIASAYYYYRAYIENKWRHYIAGAFLLAMAVMTKGIFIAAYVFAGFVIEWIIKKKWTAFLNYRWWLSMVLTGIFILPELISLYVQFDQHPEKVVFGKTHVSGIRFFFWDSQFGRFFNTGPIKGSGDPLFYVHTMLWAFLPWSVILVVLLISAIKNVKTGLQRSRNYICEGIAISGFLVFSLSRFQLPHYLNILYPFFAIIVAHYLITLNKGAFEKAIAYSQNTLYALFFLLCIGLSVIFGIQPLIPVVIALLLLAVVIYFVFPQGQLQHVIARSFAGIMVVNLFLNVLVYPGLFQYQSGNVAASFLKKQSYHDAVYMFNGLSSEYAFQFYTTQPIRRINTNDLDSLQKEILVFAPQQKIDTLQQQGYRVNGIQQFPHFHISQLTGEFINHKTRSRAVDYYTLAKVSAVNK
jgi:4-amino-4-deoxy-L-arabinose transferase-like glycosyltransferase